MLCTMSLPCNQPALEYCNASHRVCSSVRQSCAIPSCLSGCRDPPTRRAFRSAPARPPCRSRLQGCSTACPRPPHRRRLHGWTRSRTIDRSGRGHRWIERGAGGRQSTPSDALGSALRFFGAAAFAFVGVAFFGFASSASFSSPSSSESSFLPFFGAAFFGAALFGAALSGAAFLLGSSSSSKACAYAHMHTRDRVCACECASTQMPTVTRTGRPTHFCVYCFALWCCMFVCMGFCVRVCVCVCVCGCVPHASMDVHVCVRACMYYVCIYAGMYLCTYVLMHACTHACMYYMCTTRTPTLTHLLLRLTEPVIS